MSTYIFFAYLSKKFKIPPMFSESFWINCHRSIQYTDPLPLFEYPSGFNEVLMIGIAEPCTTAASFTPAEYSNQQYTVSFLCRGAWLDAPYSSNGKTSIVY
jgi:hypothetical protein